MFDEKVSLIITLTFALDSSKGSVSSFCARTRDSTENRENCQCCYVAENYEAELHKAQQRAAESGIVDGGHMRCVLQEGGVPSEEGITRRYPESLECP